ncbi:MAG: PAS domain S-box protein [Gammaproteobacteria bacterium]
MSQLEELERRLRDVEARYDGLLRAAVDGIIVIDSHGAIEAFSAGAERIFGYLADEVVGRNVAVLMPSPDADRHDEYIHNFLVTRRPKVIGFGREVMGQRKSGALFPMDLAVGEVVTPTGIRFVGIARDITRRRLAEDALRLREEAQRLMVEHAPGGIFTADLDGTLTLLNPALSRLLQAAPAVHVGLPMSELADPADRARLDAAIATVRAAGLHVEVPDLRLPRPDGSRAHVVLHLGAITRDGAPAQLIGQVVDRTDEIRAQEAARRMQDEITHVARLTTLGEMASAIAHEINQPLTAIATQAQAFRRLVASGQADTAEIVTGLDTIAEQALRIGQVVKRVRAFVTKRESAREPVDVNDAVSQVLDLAQVDARKARIRLDVDLAPALPVLTGDSVQLQQVVLNLLRNAIDASAGLDEAHRVIGIRSHAQDGGVAIRVSDRGPGVPSDHRDRLFLPFFTTKPEGVGMGLSISHSIVNAHGGSLRYADDPAGGAVFEIWLPGASDVATTCEGESRA